MTTTTTTTAHRAPRTRWTPPTLRRLPTTAATAGANQVFPEGAFGNGS